VTNNVNEPMAFQSDAGGESKVILEHIFESTRLTMIRGQNWKSLHAPDERL